eukprot:TRINITY_DN9251_c0_g1_i1.p1 TRINITY_DN9251_c0_g1~~TRINITY_DN9251_c0_g1_i1.p1  ORF type:complete len:360 (+),score=38.25 TRINITY_DN9251_c0_g1_i1:39-1118(+)
MPPKAPPRNPDHVRAFQQAAPASPYPNTPPVAPPRQPQPGQSVPSYSQHFGRASHDQHSPQSHRPSRKPKEEHDAEICPFLLEGWCFAYHHLHDAEHHPRSCIRCPNLKIDGSGVCTDQYCAYQHPNPQNLYFQDQWKLYSREPDRFEVRKQKGMYGIGHLQMRPEPCREYQEQNVCSDLNCPFQHKNPLAPVDPTTLVPSGTLVQDAYITSQVQRIWNMLNGPARCGAFVEAWSVQNPVLEKRYNAYASRAQFATGGDPPVELYACHGTADANIDAICNKGFLSNFWGTHGLVQGKGHYFAKDPGYSKSYCGGGTRMFIVKLCMTKSVAASWKEQTNHFVVPDEEVHGLLPLYVIRFK